jgi:acyl carrier protein
MANSLFALQLLDFVEREFGIAVANEDMELDNFRSIEAIAAFVARRRSQAGVRPPLDTRGARA